MSERDRKFIRTLGINPNRLATALGKSRQTVTYGVKRDRRDYIGPLDLARATGFWRQHEPSLYALARVVIQELYPEIRLEGLFKIQAETPRSASATLKGTGARAEYLFASGSLIEFANRLPACAEELRKILDDDANSILIVIHQKDHAAAARLTHRLPIERVQIKTIGPEHFLMLGLLVKTDEENIVSFFGSGDDGFVPLDRMEGVRIRSRLSELIGA